MTLKVVLLRSNEQVITDIKEIVSEDNIAGYLLHNPHKISINKPLLIGDEESLNNDLSVEITLAPWLLMSADKDIPIPNNYVVTIVEPIDSLKKMYLEKVDGSDNKVSSSEE